MLQVLIQGHQRGLLRDFSETSQAHLQNPQLNQKYFLPNALGGIAPFSLMEKYPHEMLPVSLVSLMVR